MDKKPVAIIEKTRAMDLTKLFKVTLLKDLKSGDTFVIDDENEGTWKVSLLNESNK